MNLALWIQQASQSLQASGLNLEDSQRDLSFLIEDLADISRTSQQWAEEHVLSQSQLLVLNDALTQRVARKPVSHILGYWEFWGLPFIVNQDVLTPRPDTEVLVEEALQWLHNISKPFSTHSPPIRVIDVGCGSGCIGLSLAHEWPALHLTLIDLSMSALQVAQDNDQSLRQKNMIQSDVDYLQSDLLSEYLSSDAPQVDLIVSNPPYIRSCDMKTLMPEVREYEPHLALEGRDQDGLGHVRLLTQQAMQVLRVDGALMIEVGWDQTQDCMHILQEYGFQSCRVRKDYAGHPRVVIGHKVMDE